MAKKVLIVEDEKTLLKVLSMKFSASGFDVLVAENGEEGLKMAIESEPDIILLDIIMPKMDGVTMLKRLRETPYGKGAKVMMLTNVSDAASVVESVESGVFDYLVKSNWNIDAVVAKVKTMLEGQR